MSPDAISACFAGCRPLSCHIEQTMARMSALEIFKHTARSNCGECGAATCMAFCAQAAAGQKDPAQCPYLPERIRDEIRQRAGAAASNQAANRPEAMIELIRGRMREADFEQAAHRLGGSVNGERLSFHCLGRIFELDRDGRMYSMCHVNSWVHVALLLYVLQGKGLDPRGDWVTFSQLKEARDWERFFNHRCLAAMHRTADDHPELFLDIIELFGKQYQAESPSSPHSVVLYPLPKVPFLIRYTPREGDFESTLSLLFDRTIESNLRAEGTYLLGAGLVEMFNRIIERHEQGADPLQKVRGG
jgi:hypothetical protein